METKVEFRYYIVLELDDLTLFLHNQKASWIPRMEDATCWMWKNSAQERLDDMLERDVISKQAKVITVKITKEEVND